MKVKECKAYLHTYKCSLADCTDCEYMPEEHKSTNSCNVFDWMREEVKRKETLSEKENRMG